MNSKVTLIASLLIAVFSLQSFSQQKGATIAFEKTKHNFGNIKEDGGKVSHKFGFVNTGNKPLIINDVNASCGCTSPSWTRQPVMPGDKGYVSATFDPRRRPGNFNKSIVVRSNADQSTIVLRIVGNVMPRKRTIADRYPRKIGELRMKSNHLPFVKVKHNQPKIDSLPVVNTSDEIMKVTFTNVPAHITLKLKPESLKPGEEGFIWGKFDPTKIDDWGFVIHRPRIKINGKTPNNSRLAITAKIEEDFSYLSEKELANAPKVKFDETVYNFGTAKQNSKVTHVFTFKNVGKSDLKIRKIRATCGCTTVEPDKTVIKPGEKSSFKAIFRIGNRKGYQRKLIYFISNDPHNSNMRLTIKGKVEQ